MAGRISLTCEHRAPRPGAQGRGRVRSLGGRPLVSAALIAIAGLIALVPAASAERVPPGATATDPVLAWEPCTRPEQQGLDCARLRVPRNYARPGGSKIHLAVIRRPATDPTRRVGTLFFNPGGPAESIANFPQVLEFVPESLKERFDVVTWDPRGTGRSTAVQCFDSQEEEQRVLGRVGIASESFPVGRDEQREWIQTYRRFGRRCGQRNGGLLRHLSTAESARDLDLLRRAVGDQKLSYLGISYGTFLGATYANLFPNRVRALVLDGDLNPRAYVRRQEQANAGAFLGTWLRQRSDQGAAKTLDAFLDLCGRAETTGCAFSAGSAAATRAKFETLLRRLRSGPEGAGITYAELVSQAVLRLNFTSGWSALAQMLEDVWTTGEPKRALPSSTLTPSPAPGSGTRATASGGSGGTRERYAGIEQQLAIVCSESPNPRPAAYRSLSRFARDRSGAVGPYWSWTSEPCASWPETAANRYAGPWNRRTANRVLVIGNTHDPATPYRGAKAMTRLLARARLLTVDGYGHTSLTNPSACANRHVSRYLIDGNLPPRGARCQQDREPFSESP